MKIINILISVLLLQNVAIAANIYEPVDFKKHEVVFSSSSININAFDPTSQTNASGSTFPGGRGPDQLIIYTSKFGDRTNTNEFGTEAVVQGNVVTLLSGANSLIPQDDGIVISGHGKAKRWITNNISVGTKIYIDPLNNILNAYTTSDSYMFQAETTIQETKRMIDFYKGFVSDYSCKNSSEHIQNAKEYLGKAEKNLEDQQNLKKYTEYALNEANSAMADVLPSISSELKGVWIRPVEVSESEIIKTLNNMKKIGIDNIFLETFYHGKTIFPSNVMKKYGFIRQNETFTCIDPLKIWIKEAHARNIKVHIWFQSFYVGNNIQYPSSILAVYPDWGNKTRAGAANLGPTKSSSEHNGYFLDPANPDVQDFLTQLIEEIIDRYHPDGINLDYIRYPQSVSKSESGAWGYTEYARRDFQELYGVDPINISRKDELWPVWENYRREQITDFVRKIGAIGQQKKVYVSAVIFPDFKNALATKQQDWSTWSKRHYVNGLTPLFLTYDPNMVASMMKDVQKVKSPSTDLYAGLFVTFMGGSVEDLIRQIHETRKLKANGVILFDYAHTTSKYATMLSDSAFRSNNITNLGKSNTSGTQTVKKKKFWFYIR